MPEAEIIPFPDLGRTRLARALARLDAALREQAAAVQDFRSAVCDLKQEVGRLDDGLCGFRTTLEDTAVSVMEARAVLRRLERSADGLSAACA